MSMTAEEILVNCQKEFSFIRKDLELLMMQVRKMLEDCKQLDNSKYFEEHIAKLEKEIMKTLKDLNENAYEKEVGSDTHVAIETYHEIQRYSERKRDEIANFKKEMYQFKQEVLVKEQSLIRKKLVEGKFESFETLSKAIVEEQKNSDDKIFVSGWLEKNKSLLINKNHSEIIELATNALTDDLNSAKGMTSRIINDTIKNYGSIDSEMVEAFKNEAKAFLENVNTSDVYSKAQEFLKVSSKKSEQVAVRKDNVIKIVKAIRNLGYVVSKEWIRELKDEGIILIHGEKVTGEYADFSVRMDGKFLINSEGFEKEDHDVELDSIISALRKEGLPATEAFKKQYREPAYVAKKGETKVVKKKTNQSN